MKSSRLSTPVGAFLLSALYIVGGVLGHKSSFMSGDMALVWPPAGIALAAILLFGYRMWWGVALGALVFTIFRGTPFGFFTLATAVGNTVGALVCAYLLERFVRFQNAMERLDDATGFVLFACLLGTTVNATFNAIGLCYNGQLPWNMVFANAMVWWIPNAMGVLVVTPFILAWACPSAVRISKRGWVEIALWTVGLIIGTQTSFNSWFVYGVESYPLAFLPYPFLVWGAVRFGQRGGTTGTFIVAGYAIYELLHHRGPFWLGADKTSLMLMGCYIGVVAVSNLLLAGAVVEREVAVRGTIESEKRYRGVVEDQTDLICRFRPDGALVFANRAYCRFMARPREQLLGTNFFPGLSEQDREIPLRQFACLTPTEPIQTFDNKLQLGEGRLLWQQCTVRALFDDNGRIAEFQAVMQDITRRKQSEEALRLGEERVRAILNSMVDGVLVLKNDGTIMLMNPAAERIFQRPAPVLTGRSVRSLFPQEDWPNYCEYLERHLGQNPPKVIEVKATGSNGGTQPIDVVVSQIAQGGERMFVLVVREISERKKLEEQCRQSQKMEAVGRLAGGIAHDFNNLMQAILGYTSLLDRRLSPADPNHETVGHIQKSLANAMSLTRQLLAFSRKQVLKPKLLALNGVVADMTRLLQRLLGETVQLKLKLSDPPPCIRADPGQIEQLILNLSINARDAMPKGGVLSIETSRVTLAEPTTFSSGRLPAGSYALLAISDTGCGMSEEVQSHIFEPFFTTKENGKGTGLGLSNVYGIVKQSGGEIAVSTAPGRGASFLVYLPCLDASPAHEAPAPVLPATAGGSETVLLVEDEELVRMMLIEVLKAGGYTVLEASHGADAMSLAERYRQPINLLVTDVTMPGFSGLELSQRLREQRPLMNVLFISGYTAQDASQWSKLNQPLQFLQKPFHPDTFMAKVRRILDQPKG
jgi:PAS domain S-box-containing protein